MFNNKFSFEFFLFIFFTSQLLGVFELFLSVLSLLCSLLLTSVPPSDGSSVAIISFNSNFSIISKSSLKLSFSKDNKFLLPGPTVNLLIPCSESISDISFVVLFFILGRFSIKAYSKQNRRQIDIIIYFSFLREGIKLEKSLLSKYSNKSMKYLSTGNIDLLFSLLKKFSEER